MAVLFPEEITVWILHGVREPGPEDRFGSIPMKFPAREQSPPMEVTQDMKVEPEGEGVQLFIMLPERSLLLLKRRMED